MRLPIPKVKAYRCPKGMLETDPTRAFAWILEAASNENLSFSNCLWILENAQQVRMVLDSYEHEKRFGMTENEPS